MRHGLQAYGTAGAIAVPINSLYAPSELEGALNEVGAETVVVLTRFYGKVKSLQTRTPVRRVIDRAASLVNVDKLCFALVVDAQGSLEGLFSGTPETAWEQASELSRQLHITYKEKPFHTILSCAPPMYDELWTAGKCMYKLEPVLADGGELIIYAPHLKEI